MSDTENKNITRNDEEIDLYPYWLAIRNRWKMIAGLVLIAVVGAGVATRYLPKVYRVNALISLGRVEMSGRTQPLATLDDINQMMGSGNLLKKITTACHLDETQVGAALEKGLSAEAKKDSEYVFLKYDTAKPDEGIAILNALITEIQNSYNPRTENYRKAKDSEINKLKEDIAAVEFQRSKMEVKIKQLLTQIDQRKRLAQISTQTLESQKASILAQIKNYEDRIRALTSAKAQMGSMTATLEQNTQDLLKGKSAFAQASTGEGLLASLLFSNNLQQNITAMNLSKEKLTEYDMDMSDARKEIDLLKIEQAVVEGQIKETVVQTEFEIGKLQIAVRENELEMEKSIPAEIAKVTNGMQSLEIQKSMIEGITVVADPDYFNIPIKSKKNVIISTAILLSFLTGIILACLQAGQSRHPSERSA
jgi:hypothetical protein